MADQLPLYRHPTLTVLLDDDAARLDPTVESMRADGMVRSFTEPSEALSWIADNLAMTARLPDPLANKRPLAAPPLAGDVGAIDSIYRYVEDPQRFCTPAVVVIQVKRPGPQAMEFVEAIAHKPIKKLWYSSIQDQPQVVRAFNRGLIDKYISTELESFFPHMREEVSALEQDYFTSRTARRRDRQLHDETYQFLSDSAFAGQVQDLMDRHGFVEYYLFTSPSGLLFFDSEGNPTLMVVQTGDALLAQFELARDGGAPEQLQQDLRDGKVVPFFETSDGMYADSLPRPATSYCRAASVCDGAQPYYWALFELPPSYRKGTPFSHARFLRSGAGS